MKSLQLVMMTFSILAVGPVFAHTELVETIPADRANIAAAPADVRLTFSEPVRLTALTIQGDGAQKQSLGPLPSGTAEEFSVGLSEMLEDGHYVVTWRALSADTHVMSGEFMFAVGAEEGRDARSQHVPAAQSAHHGGGH